jgi:D-glycero-alpha-D-manno-heptose-7-phosphate kinase
MIIVRSPLRVAFGGGGTDLPSYYERFGGYVVSAAINKYVYIAMNYSFHNELILKYSHMERVKKVEDIKHPIIRECFRMLDIPCSHLEIASMADIPGGTGLGSSSSFTCALLHLLHTHKRQCVKPTTLAEEAFEIEAEILKAPIGKQDQYASAYGGLREYVFKQDGETSVKELDIPRDVKYDLEDNLLLFFTGSIRCSAKTLREQDDKSRSGDGEMLEQLTIVKQLAYMTTDALKKGDMQLFAELMNQHWISKKKRSKHMSNPKIDRCYDLALKNGAMGGRLVGAGGGGFLMFYAEDHQRLREEMYKEGLKECRFKFDTYGTKVVETS